MGSRHTLPCANFTTVMIIEKFDIVRKFNIIEKYKIEKFNYNYISMVL